MPISLAPADYMAILPAAILFATGLVVLIADLLVKQDGYDDPSSQKSHLVFLGLCGSALAFASLFAPQGLLAGAWGQDAVAAGSQTVFMGALRVDAFGGFIAAVIIVAIALTTLASGGYLASQDQNRGEFYGLVFLGGGAMLLLAQASNLISIFVAIETLSLSVYVLAGFFRKWKSGSEGALKYFILGAFSSGFLLMGMMLIYGATGEVTLEALGKSTSDPYLLNIGLLLLLVGFGFKVGAVPFHSWVPDAYQGAPTTAAGWMAVAVKVCSFGALLRVVIASSQGGLADASTGKMLAALAVVTMVLGNLAALNQTNIKRMLAYSGIAHTGYLLIPVVLAFQGTDPKVGAGALFYLAAYLLMTIGAFTAIAMVSTGDTDREELEDFNGLAKRQPFVAFALTVSLLSMAGMPGTAGFLGKLTIFRDAVESGPYFYLALIGILASLVSVYYYLRPIVAMYFREEGTTIDVVENTWGVRLTLFITSFGTLILFFWGRSVHELSIRSIESITG
ncbi:MAG: NADH-quinone oxidoreductase subunit N [Planctomycetota bacterium]